MPIVTDTEYTLLSSGDNIVQNKSSGYIRLVHSATLPSVGVTEYFSLAPLEAFVTLNGVPSGNTYARAESGAAQVTVGV